MYNYATLNDEKICIGISSLIATVARENMVEITEYKEDYLWKKYENGKWSEEKYPPPEPKPDPVFSLEDYILDLEFRLSMIELGGM